jgi:hypothetical protein
MERSALLKIKETKPRCAWRLQFHSNHFLLKRRKPKSAGKQPKQPEQPEQAEQTEGVEFSALDFKTKIYKPTYERGESKAVLLLKAKRKQEKLAKQLAADDTGKLREQAAWASVLSKAQLVKNKDDPARLEKTLKRRQKQKERSRKEWEERSGKQNKAVEARKKQGALNKIKKKRRAQSRKILKRAARAGFKVK